jgi:hypothetical protein
MDGCNHRVLIIGSDRTSFLSAAAVPHDYSVLGEGGAEVSGLGQARRALAGMMRLARGRIERAKLAADRLACGLVCMHRSSMLLCTYVHPQNGGNFLSADRLQNDHPCCRLRPVNACPVPKTKTSKEARGNVSLLPQLQVDTTGPYGDGSMSFARTATSTPARVRAGSSSSLASVSLAGSRSSSTWWSYQAVSPST